MHRYTPIGNINVRTASMTSLRPTLAELMCSFPSSIFTKSYEQACGDKRLLHARWRGSELARTRTLLIKARRCSPACNISETHSFIVSISSWGMNRIRTSLIEGRQFILNSLFRCCAIFARDLLWRLAVCVARERLRKEIHSSLC